MNADRTYEFTYVVTDGSNFKKLKSAQKTAFVAADNYFDAITKFRGEVIPEGDDEYHDVIEFKISKDIILVN